MLTDKLIPNVEQRMAAWHRIQEQLRKEVPVKSKPTITISRQYGCEGYPLAEALKEQVEQKTGDPWTIFDKALIERVSRDTTLSRRILSNLGDASKPVHDVLATLMPGWESTHAEAYAQLARQVIALAQAGNVIIVGRGGAVLTQKFPNCFHFRLVAPLEHRIQSIQERLKISPEEARALVIENQQVRDHFVESFLHCSIADPCFYHSVFNTSKNKIPAITHCIVHMIFGS
ncbi:MAG: AAA family ATPase [Syntrophobacteraceae bacterium]